MLTGARKAATEWAMVLSMICAASHPPTEGFVSKRRETPSRVILAKVLYRSSRLRTGETTIFDFEVSEDEILDELGLRDRSGPGGAMRPKVASIVVERLGAELGECKVFPLVGPCKPFTAHYRCTLDLIEEIGSKIEHHHKSTLLDKSCLFRYPCKDRSHPHPPSIQPLFEEDADTSEIPESFDAIDWLSSQMDRGLDQFRGVFFEDRVRRCHR